MGMQNKSDEIEEIFSYYSQQPDKGSQEMVVALLRELQDAHGFISLELKERVEQVTGVSPNYLKCLIRMYPTLKEENTVHEIIACTGERCGKKEGGAILNALKRELRIQKNGVSIDGKFKLRTQNCLKKCGTAPNIIIDDVVYSGSELKDLKKLLEKFM